MLSCENPTRPEVSMAGTALDGAAGAHGAAAAAHGAAAAAAAAVAAAAKKKCSPAAMTKDGKRCCPCDNMDNMAAAIELATSVHDNVSRIKGQSLLTLYVVEQPYNACRTTI